MYNIVMAFFFFYCRPTVCAETVSGPANRPLEISHLLPSAVAVAVVVAVARSLSYHQSLRVVRLVDVDM